MASRREKMLQAVASVDFGAGLISGPPVEVGYAKLKDYVKRLSKVGLQDIAGVLAYDPGQALKGEEPLSELSQQTSGHAEEPSRRHLDDNFSLRSKTPWKEMEAFGVGSEDVPRWPRWDDQDLVMHLYTPTKRGIHRALASYEKLVQGVYYDSKKAQWALPLEQGQVQLGGWTGGGYDEVQLPAGQRFDKHEQKAVVFSLYGTACREFLRVYGLLEERDSIQSMLKDVLPESEHGTPKLLQIDLLFNFSAQNHYKYHNDPGDMDAERTGGVPIVSTIMNMSPGYATMRMAGAKKDAEYMFPGDTVMFPSHGWHRSGHCEFRGVKVALFWAFSKQSNFALDLESFELGPLPVKQETVEPAGGTPSGSSDLLPASDPTVAQQALAVAGTVMMTEAQSTEDAFIGKALFKAGNVDDGSAPVPVADVPVASVPVASSATFPQSAPAPPPPSSAEMEPPPGGEALEPAPAANDATNNAAADVATTDPAASSATFPPQAPLSSPPLSPTATEPPPGGDAATAAPEHAQDGEAKGSNDVADDPDPEDGSPDGTANVPAGTSVGTSQERREDGEAHGEAQPPPKRQKPGFKIPKKTHKK